MLLTESTVSETSRAPSYAPSFAAVMGSVTGGDHRRAERDGQDGFARVATPHLAAAIVTDGCSSGASSEVGARLGAVWLRDLITRRFPCADPVRGAEDVTTALIERLTATARSLSGGDAIDRAVVGDLLLFGFLAAVVTRESAIVFGVGDGVAWVNGAVTRIDPGPENAPPYPAYALLGAAIAPRILHLDETRASSLIAIGTDGVEDLLEPRSSVELASADRLDALVHDARIFTNPSLLRKRLLVLSSRGHFWDDATLAIVRRRA